MVKELCTQCSVMQTPLSMLEETLVECSYMYKYILMLIAKINKLKAQIRVLFFYHSTKYYSASICAVILYL